MRVRAVLFGTLLCAIASSAQAQLMPGPTVVLGPPGNDNANVVSCLPGSTVAGTGATCTFTVMTPNVPDLVCIRVVNNKTAQSVAPVGVDPTTFPFPNCIPANPNSLTSITVNRPSRGTGSILGSISGRRVLGEITQSSGNVQIPDTSPPRTTQLDACPLRAVLIALGLLEAPDPLCPLVSNDITPGEFPEQ